MSVSRTKIRVRYAETDQMGVVYHANFFVWFEVGRVELLRQLTGQGTELPKIRATSGDNGHRDGEQ